VTRDDVEAIKQAFSESLDPVLKELRAIREELHSKGNRLVRVEGILDGVEILVRKKT